MHTNSMPRINGLSMWGVSVSLGQGCAFLFSADNGLVEKSILMLANEVQHVFDVAAVNGAMRLDSDCGLFGVMGGSCRVLHGSSGHTIGGVIVDCGL